MHGRRVGAAAIMTAQAVLLFVVGETYIAVFALGDPTAGLTLPHRHVTTAVLEDDRLLLARDGVLDPFDQHFTEVATHLLAFLRVSNVHAADLRQRCLAVPH